MRCGLFLLTRTSFVCFRSRTAEEAHAKLYDEMVEKYEVEYIAGGATQNSIRVAQWMMPASPGATAYMGCVGRR